MTSVGARDRPRGGRERLHRALARRHAGSRETRGLLREAHRAEPSRRGPAAARRGWRTRGGAPTRRRRPRCRRARSGRRAPRRRRGGRARSAAVGDAGGRALEDEAARRRSGGRRRAGARPAPRASSRGRAPARRRTRAQDRRPGRPPSRSTACAPGSAGSSCRPWPGQVDDDDAAGAATNAVAWSPQPDPRPVNPWSSRSGRAGPAAPDLPAQAVDARCALIAPSAGASRDGGCRVAVELDVPRPVGPQLEDADARPADRRAPSRLGSRRRRPRPVLAARARSRSARRRSRAASRTAPRSARAGPTRATPVGAWGRNEKIPPPSLLTSTIVADRPCSSGGHERVEVVQERHVADDERDRARHRPRPRTRAPSTRRRRSRSRRGSQRTVIARAVDGSQPSRSRTGIELPAHSSAPSGSDVGRARRTAAPSNGSSSAAQPAVHRARRRRAPRRASRAPTRARRGAAARARIGQRPGGRAASAWTNVGGQERGLAPAAVAVDRRRARAARRSSSWRIGLEVGIAPKRMTRSGRCASIHGPGRTSWSARLTTLRPVVRPARSAGQRVGEDREAGRARRGRRAPRAAPGRRPGPRR